MSNSHTLTDGHLRRLNENLSWYERNKGRLDMLLRKGGSRQGQILGGDSLTPCELKDDMAPGGTDVEAYPMLADMSDADTSADTILVNDLPGGSTRALGRDTMGETEGGAQGWYTAGPDGKNYFIPGKQQAKMCYCLAKIASGNTLSTVDNVVPMDGGQSPVASSSATLSVASGFETNDNAGGVIAWDETNSVWRPLDFPCKTA